jgi:hypothetical protein
MEEVGKISAWLCSLHADVPLTRTEWRKKGNGKRNYTTKGNEARNVEIKKGLCFVLGLKVCSQRRREDRADSPPPL